MKAETKFEIRMLCPGRLVVVCVCVGIHRVASQVGWCGAGPINQCLHKYAWAVTAEPILSHLISFPLNNGGAITFLGAARVYRRRHGRSDRSAPPQMEAASTRLVPV